MVSRNEALTLANIASLFGCFCTSLHANRLELLPDQRSVPNARLERVMRQVMDRFFQLFPQPSVLNAYTMPADEFMRGVDESDERYRQLRGFVDSLR